MPQQPDCCSIQEIETAPPTLSVRLGIDAGLAAAADDSSIKVTILAVEMPITALLSAHETQQFGKGGQRVLCAP